MFGIAWGAQGDSVAGNTKRVLELQKILRMESAALKQNSSMAFVLTSDCRNSKQKWCFFWFSSSLWSFSMTVVAKSWPKKINICLHLSLPHLGRLHHGHKWNMMCICNCTYQINILSLSSLSKPLSYTFLISHVHIPRFYTYGVAVSNHSECSEKKG